MRVVKKNWLRAITALSIIFVLTTSYLILPQTFFSLDNRLRDFLFVLRGPQPSNSDIVIIDIDEKSLAQEGQWPWSRNRVAQLLQNLSGAEAGIIGLDIVFSEHDRSSPHTIASQLGSSDAHNLDNYDDILAETIANTPTIGGYFYTFDQKSNSETPMIPAVFVEKGRPSHPYIIAPNNLVLNIPPLQNAFYSSGFFNNTPDDGGMIRRVPLIMRYEGVLYPSLTLEMVRIYTQENRVSIHNTITGVETVELGALTIPTDPFGRMLINFQGPSRHYRYISASDILNRTFDPKSVKGKFVLIGTSAVGLSDLRATPFDSVVPGVEIHATIIDNLLTQNFIAPDKNGLLIDLFLITFTVALIFILLSLINVWLVLPLFIFILYSEYLFFSTLLFSYGIVLNILFVLLATILSFIAALFLDYLSNLRQKQMVLNIFAKKVSPEVMDDLIKNSSNELLRPRTKEVTIFFSDIRSFTHISEKLADPERVVAMLNTYMTPMVENITIHQGTIDKFIGDAIMAYWNAPIKIEGHADKAVTSALEQLKRLTQLNHQLKQEFDIEINIGIGIHTGEVTIGEMGSTGRSDYTIIGDNVNLASRLEGLSKLYGANIIISEATKRALTASYPIRSLDIVKVKGKEKAVEIFEILQTPIDSKEVQQYEKALTYYRTKKVQEALTLFTQLQADSKTTLYALYVMRCEEAIKDLATFDPITTMHHK